MTRTKTATKKTTRATTTVATLSSLDDDFTTSLGGSSTASGETVGPTSALRLSTYFACIRNISEDVATLPIAVYERQGGRTKIRVDHPIDNLMNDSPNSEMSAMTFRETLLSHAMGWGDGFAEIVRDGSGNPTELWPLTPDRVRVIRMVDKSLWYEVSGANGGRAAYIPAEDMLHVHGLGYDGLRGYSVASYARETLGTGLALERFSGSFFGNGAMPGSILEHPATISPKALTSLRASWNEMHKGAGRAHKVAILEEGMKLNKLTIPPNDAQFIESKQHGVEDVCRWFRMPPHLVQHLLRATFANIEHQSLEYAKFTLRSWIERWNQECVRKLMTPKESGLLEVRHDTTELTRADIQTRYTAQQSAITAGWKSINDVRLEEGYDPIEGGDTYMVPMNMTPADLVHALVQSQIAKNAAPVPAKPAKDDPLVRDLSAPIKDALSRLLRKESDRAKAAAKKPETFVTWLDEFYAEQRDSMICTLSPAVVSFNAAMHRDLDPAQIADEHIRLSKEELLEAAEVNRGKLQESVTATVSAWEKQRAEDVTLVITRADS